MFLRNSASLGILSSRREARHAGAEVAYRRHTHSRHTHTPDTQKMQGDTVCLGCTVHTEISRGHCYVGFRGFLSTVALSPPPWPAPAPSHTLGALSMPAGRHPRPPLPPCIQLWPLCRPGGPPGSGVHRGLSGKRPASPWNLRAGYVGRNSRRVLGSGPSS